MRILVKRPPTYLVEVIGEGPRALERGEAVDVSPHTANRLVRAMHAVRLPPTAPATYVPAGMDTADEPGAVVAPAPVNQDPSQVSAAPAAPVVTTGRAVEQGGSGAAGASTTAAPTPSKPKAKRKSRAKKTPAAKG